MSTPNPNDRDLLAYLERLRPLAAARESLAAFVMLMRPDFEIVQHIARVCEALERVARGELRRLVIIAPPRHSKSETAVRQFISWFLGLYPDRRVIVSTYGQSLADDHGRDCRRIMNSDAWRTLFGHRLASDSQARDAFDIADHYGGARFVGRGGAITGRGCDLLLIDDLLKNREESDSVIVRESAWDFYSAVLRTRLEPNGAIVVIGTRWHHDDYLGRLIAGSGEPFEVLHFPAIDDAGEPLWPSRFPLEELEAIRSTLSGRDWSALYQGSPTPDTGDYFRRDWFRYRERTPSTLRVFMAADLAYSTGGDYTAIAIVGVDSQGVCHVLDFSRRRGVLHDSIAEMVRLIRLHDPRSLCVESDPGTRAVLDTVKRELMNAGHYRHIMEVSAAGDKEAKARGIQSRFERGLVTFPRGAGWLAALESELLSFPAARNDDQVDALSLVGRVLPRIGTPSAPTDPELPPVRNVTPPPGHIDGYAFVHQGKVYPGWTMGNPGDDGPRGDGGRIP